MRLEIVLFLVLVLPLAVAAYMKPGRAWAMADPFFQDLKAIHVAAQLEPVNAPETAALGKALADAAAKSIARGLGARLGVSVRAQQDPGAGLHDPNVVTVLLQGQLVPCSQVLTGQQCTGDFLLLTVRLFRRCPANDYRNVFPAPPEVVHLPQGAKGAGVLAARTLPPGVQEALERMLSRALGRPATPNGPVE